VTSPFACKSDSLSTITLSHNVQYALLTFPFFFLPDSGSCCQVTSCYCDFPDCCCSYQSKGVCCCQEHDVVCQKMMCWDKQKKDPNLLCICCKGNSLCVYPYTW
jgi:hypothetical protein